MLRLQLECKLKRRMSGGHRKPALTAAKAVSSSGNPLRSPGHLEEGRPNAEEQGIHSELARL